MSIYPVDSPGGYQMTGRTLPCFDLLGSKTASSFSPTKPWLFEDFDLLTFHQVSESELDILLAQFERGEYVWEWEDTEFDMAEHNKLLEETREEVRGIRERQAAAQAEMNEAEKESLRRWRKDKEKDKVDEGTVDEMLSGMYSLTLLHFVTCSRNIDLTFHVNTDPALFPLEAPVDANIWKIEVQDGDTVPIGHTITVLEAMKLEIAVQVPGGDQDDDNSNSNAENRNGGGAKAMVKVEKVLVKTGVCCSFSSFSLCTGGAVMPIRSAVADIFSRVGDCQSWRTDCFAQTAVGGVE